MEQAPWEEYPITDPHPTPDPDPHGPTRRIENGNVFRHMTQRMAIGLTMGGIDDGYITAAHTLHISAVSVVDRSAMVD